MFCGEPMAYETLVMCRRELIAIPGSTVVGCFCEQNSLHSALLTKSRPEKLKNSKGRMPSKNKIKGADSTFFGQLLLSEFVIGDMMAVEFLQNFKAI